MRSEEKLTQDLYRRGHLEPEPETTDHEWLWITTLDTQVFPATVVCRLGHDRWKLENNGWNDLTQNRALKHVSFYTPVATTRERMRQTANALGSPTGAWPLSDQHHRGGPRFQASR